MPLLVRFLLRHAAIGFGIAILFVGALLAFDAQSLRSLLLAAPDGWVAASALTFAMGLTFSSVQMGAAVMLLTTRNDGPSGGRRARLQAQGHLVPAPVRVRAAR